MPLAPSPPILGTGAKLMGNIGARFQHSPASELDYDNHNSVNNIPKVPYCHSFPLHQPPSSRHTRVSTLIPLLQSRKITPELLGLLTAKWVIQTRNLSRHHQNLPMDLADQELVL